MINEQARDAAFEKIFNEPFDDSHEAICFTLGFDAGAKAERERFVQTVDDAINFATIANEHGSAVDAVVIIKNYIDELRGDK